MKKMSRSLTKYYLDRLILFWSKARIADELKTSRQLVHHWFSGHSTPTWSKRRRFEKALSSLIQELHSRGGFYSRVATALDFDDPPEDRPMVEKMDLRELEARLRDQMIVKGKLRSTKLYDEFLPLGYSRNQIINALRTLGYSSESKGRGRNSYTIWRER